MKQVIEVHDIDELRQEEGKLYVCRRYDGGCDGNLWYKGDTTIDRYIELADKIYHSHIDNLGEFLRFADEIHKQQAAECDPQEVYIYEYNNCECQYTDDGAAYRIIVDIFGDEIANQIKRF